MATVALSTRLTPALAPATEAATARRRAIALPPRQVWPLLSTILTTALIMLAIIGWHAAPDAVALAAAIAA